MAPSTVRCAALFMCVTPIDTHKMALTYSGTNQLTRGSRDVCFVYRRVPEFLCKD